MPVIACQSILALRFMMLIHAGLLCFPEGLVPVGLVDHLPFPSPFEFLLGVRSGEEDLLLLLPLFFFLDRARSCTNLLLLTGVSWSNLSNIRWIRASITLPSLLV